jgi:hypothetical protein
MLALPQEGDRTGSRLHLEAARARALMSQLGQPVKAQCEQNESFCLNN